MPRLLVTGVSGLLGANFALKATERFDVTGVYSKHPVTLPGVVSSGIDLLSVHGTTDFLDELKPKFIAHFAASTDVDFCELNQEEATLTNEKMTRRLAQWAAANKCVFLFMSTDSVFDGKKGAYSEDDTAKPANHYAETKLSAEKIVASLVPQHLIIRANIYGWNCQNKKSLAEWVLSNLQHQKTLHGFTDVIFNPLLVNTLSELMLRLLQVEAHGLLHLGSLNSCSKFDFARSLARLHGFPLDLVKPRKLANALLKAPRPLNTSLRVEMALTEFGLCLPTIEEDLLKFKELLENGFVNEMKSYSHGK